MSNSMKWFCCLFALVVLAGCGQPAPSDAPTSTPSSSANSNASLKKEDYPVLPDADAGADPAVSAELGGKGFTGEGWETKTDFELTGDPRAVKGGLFRNAISDFPGTLRMGGPEWNTYVNYMIGDMVYETLLGLDPTTL